MNKKTIGLIIFLLSLILVFTACNSDKEKDKSMNNNDLKKLEISTDYSKEDNWLNRPVDGDKDIDVVYFYPTTYSKNANNGDNISDIDDTKMREGALNVFSENSQVFASTCNVYAPYYRQCDGSYALSLEPKENEKIVEELSKSDPTAALDYYFENYNKGKPFILAGHSQGSEVLVMLLKNYMKEHPKYYKNMIVAYPIGYSVTKDYLKENKHLKFAEGAFDIGVIVSYNTEGPDNNKKDNAVVREGAVAINPINWKLDETKASVNENLGFYEDGKIVKGIANARLDTKRGVLVCDSVENDRYAMPLTDLFGPSSYHMYDYNFYFANLKKNVEDRINTWESEKR